MPDMRKNAEHTVTIEGYTSTGDGVARIGGQVVFVKGALRGEKCKIKILKVLRNIIYAKPVSILTQSPHRQTPACPNFGKCGGCDLMHMDYNEELDTKRLRVEDALRRIGGFDIGVPEIIGSDLQEGYRNKAIYAVGEDDGHAVTGFYRERSHDIIPAEKCHIQANISDRAAFAVRRWMDGCGIPCYDEKSRTGAIRHVFCRYAFATGKAQVTIVTADGRLDGLDELIAAIRASCPEMASIVININKTRGNTVLAGEFRTVWGDDYIEDELCSLRFKLSPRSFYQINRTQAEKLYAKVLELSGLTERDTALDLYCGTGTITLLLARRAGRVIGVEIVEAAIADARENAELNGIKNAEFICADAQTAATELKAAGTSPDVVVVDPPRKGLAADVIDTISDLSPSRIVYVSCNPATLARDMKLLTQRGYTPGPVTAFDMFPRCAHVETVVLLTRD